MKKTTFLLALFVIVFAVAALPARAAELEKISSPDQIKLFQVMKKEGNALYGVRLQNKASSTAIAVAKNDLLEKIAAPSLVPLYEKVRQIGSALWGVKKSATSTSIAVTVRAEAAGCVAEAIRAKDESLKTTVAEMSAALQEAIGGRSACQQAAVKVTESQRAEIEACVKAFRTAHQRLVEAYKKSHLAAWNAYKAALRSCQPSEVSSQQLMVEDGSEKIIEGVMEISQ